MPKKVYATKFESQQLYKKNGCWSHCYWY